MAKDRPIKKYEFKPDAEHGNLLNRLIPTPSQRQAILKWLLFAAALLVLLLLQDVVFSRLRIFGTTPDLVSAAILLICVSLGGETGCVFALIASLLYVFSGSAAGTYSIALLTILGSTAAIFRQAYLRKGFSAAMLCSSAAVMLYELGVFIINLITERTIFARLGVFCLTGILSCVALPILYPIVQSIGKIGGETWKE